MDAPKEEWVRGRAVKCRPCRGTLLLSALAFRQHVASNKHAKAAAKAAKAEAARRRQRRGADSDGSSDDEEGEAGRWRAFCFAEDYESGSEEEVETHTERLQRLNAALEAAKQQKAATAAKKQARQERRQQQNRQRVPKPQTEGAGKAGAKAEPGMQHKGAAETQKRPGKRQRQELKEKGLWKTKQRKPKQALKPQEAQQAQQQQPDKKVPKQAADRPAAAAVDGTPRKTAKHKRQKKP
jgi:colicin import membrane protein